MERRTRYTLFVLYLVALLVLSRGVTGSWFPSTGDMGTWFHSGLLLVVVGALLFEMYFTKPTDALVNSLMVFVTMYSITDSSSFLLWKPIVVLSLSVFVSAAIAMLVGNPKDSPSSWRNRIAKVFYDYSTLLGSARVLFSLVFFASAVSYYRAQAASFLYMILFWAVVILTEQLHPDALVSSLFSLFKSPARGPILAGSVTAVVNPRLVTVETEPDLWLEPEQVVMLTDSATSAASPTAYGIVVSAQKYVDHGMLQVLLVSPPCDTDASFDKVGSHAWLTDASETPEWMRDSLELKHRGRLVGLVGAGTDIGGLKIRCLDHSKIEEGFLVEVFTRNRWITYQVTGAKASLVSEGEGSGFATTEVTAAQIGCWSHQDLGFERFGWLPSLNDAVLLVEPDGEVAQSESEDYFRLGTMPHSDYPVLLDREKLVTHHAAILGITGSGKSRLAHRLVAGIVARGMKVISVDFTGEHRRELQDLGPVILSDCERSRPISPRTAAAASRSSSARTKR